MDGIDKTIFISRLKENKLNFSSIEEMVEYQLPVLQYYLEHYQSPIYSEDMQTIIVEFASITILPPKDEGARRLMNLAFSGLVKRLNEFDYD